MKAKIVESREATRREKFLSMGYNNWLTVWEVEGKQYKIWTSLPGGSYTQFDLRNKLKLKKKSKGKPEPQINIDEWRESALNSIGYECEIEVK